MKGKSRTDYLTEEEKERNFGDDTKTVVTQDTENENKMQIETVENPIVNFQYFKVKNHFLEFVHTPHQFSNPYGFHLNEEEKKCFHKNNF